MKTTIAFLKKEWLGEWRSGRALILCLLFVLIGVMNPAVAKLTPWIMASMADSLAASGFIVTEVTVTALDSWTQFFKNVPMALIAFVLLESGIFTREYASGTLVLTLTKGLSRRRVLMAKTFMLTALWTAGYWLCFGITYGYNAYFWDNAVARNLAAASVYWWLFGLAMTALTVLFSVLGSTHTAVLGGDAAAVAACYLAGLIPQAGEYLPTRLMEGTSLVYGAAAPGDYRAALAVTAGLIVLCIGASIPLFDKKRL